GADVHATVEVGHVLIGEADAAGGHALADGRGRIGAVNAVYRAAEIHGARAKRVGRAAGHEARQVGLALDHFGRRRPIRPLGLLGDRLHARPAEAVAADADAVADRAATGLHEIKIGVRRVDDDGAGRLAAVVGDDLAPELRRRLVALLGLLLDRPHLVGARVHVVREAERGSGRPVGEHRRSRDERTREDVGDLDHGLTPVFRLITFGALIWFPGHAYLLVAAGLEAVQGGGGDSLTARRRG